MFHSTRTSASPRLRRDVQNGKLPDSAQATLFPVILKDTKPPSSAPGLSGSRVRASLRQPPPSPAARGMEMPPGDSGCRWRGVSPEPGRSRPAEPPPRRPTRDRRTRLPRCLPHLDPSLPLPSARPSPTGGQEEPGPRAGGMLTQPCCPLRRDSLQLPQLRVFREHWHKSLGTLERH